MSKTDERILITGAGGMLGGALTDLLVAAGRKPVALTRSQLDVADDASLSDAFEVHRPTLVLNCAAHTKVDLCEKEQARADAVNRRAVALIAELCRRHGSTLVHPSTDFVFDGKLARPYKPDDTVNPLSAYGRTKLFGEVSVQAVGPPRWLIVRTAWVYGRRGANFPRTIVQAARDKKPLKVVNDQFGAPTYADDLAQAILELLATDAAGIWHITNAGKTTWHEFAVAALKAFGIDAPVEPVNSAQWARIRPGSAIRPAYSVLDLSALTAKIKRPMRNWTDALADYKTAVDRDGF